MSFIPLLWPNIIFFTGVPRNLRVLPVLSKGSTGPPVLSKKLNCVRQLRPLDAFSTLLVGPKCICGRGSTPNPTVGAYSAPRCPSWWGGGPLLTPQEPLPCSWPSASNFGPLGLSGPPLQKKKTWVLWAICHYCCEGFRFTEKVEKYCSKQSSQLRWHQQEVL